MKYTKSVYLVHLDKIKYKQASVQWIHKLDKERVSNTLPRNKLCRIVEHRVVKFNYVNPFCPSYIAHTFFKNQQRICSFKNFKKWMYFKKDKMPIRN